jgi:hypothetical protein
MGHFLFGSRPWPGHGSGLLRPRAGAGPRSCQRIFLNPFEVRSEIGLDLFPAACDVGLE